MKKNLLLLIPVIGFAGVSFLSKNDRIEQYHADGIETVEFSSNPPGAKTGAPGENTCTQCHTGSVMDGDGVVFFTLSGGPNYMPGTTYPITVSTVGGAKNGFELTILNGDNDQVGSFTAGANSNVVVTDGKEYVRHSASLGEGSWTFDWTAPATDEGELTAYYVLNKANNNGSTSGDEIFMSTTALPLVGVGIEENKLDQAYNVFFNSQTRELNLNYALDKNAKVVLNIQDLSGRLIEYYDFGIQNTGNYTELLPVNKVDKSGVYLVSLFVDNKVFNRKIMFN